MYATKIEIKKKKTPRQGPIDIVIFTRGNIDLVKKQKFVFSLSSRVTSRDTPAVARAHSPDLWELQNYPKFITIILLITIVISSI